MSISRKFQRSKSKYTLSQKIISAVTAAGFIMQPLAGFAHNIVASNDFGTKVETNGNVTDIWAGKVVGNTAINKFDKFGLNANEIANMYFGKDINNHNADNLVNFVNSRIDINGTVNAIQNSQIGGNLFFLSKEGMAVGKSGVINTGSLYVMTPTPDFMEAVQTVGTEAPAEDANKYLGYITNITDPTKANAWEIIPVNTSGTITVLGKVNATNEVQMRAAKIGVGKNVSGEDLHDGENDAVGTIKDGVVNSAYIKTGITNFADIVNIKNADGTAIITESGLTGDLQATQTGSGDIVLSAYVDGATETNDLEELPFIGGTFGPIAETAENTFVEQDFNASVDVYGYVETTEKKGNININATAVNSNADFNEQINDYELNDNDVAQLANVKAEVNIGGTVKAAEDVTVKAEAINRYIDNSGAVAKAVSVGVSSGTPITGDVAYSVLNTEANVNITSDGSIKSGKGVDIDAKAETLAASAASVTALKFKAAGGTTGANVPAVSVLYTNAVNKANVTVEGNINAAENISIDADADMKVDAENKMGIKGKMGNQFVVGVTVAGAENSASVDIKDEDNSNNVINAGNDLSVNANATSDFTSGTSIKAPEASAMAVAVNVTDFNSNAKVNIDTDLTAGNDLTVKADNIITDDNVIAESTIGSGKYVSAATQVVTGHVEQKKGEVKEFISGLAAVLGKGKKLPIGDEDEIPGLQLSEIFKAGATVTYSGQKHDSSVTIGKNASLKANEGKLDIGALTKIEDAHITATGTTSSYNDAYPAELTVNAAVLVNNMDNSSSVVVADRDEGSADALKGKNGVSVNASTRFEYNRIKNMIQDVKDAAKQIASAVDDLDDSIKNDFDGFINTLKEQIIAWESAFKTADETLATSDKGVLAIGEAATAGYNVLTALNNLNTMLDNRGSEVAADTKAAIQGASDLLTSALAFADPNSYGNFAASSASKGSSGDTGSIAGHHSSAVNGAGTVMVNTVNSVSKVEIGSNAVINAVGKVELNAENYMKDVSLGGLNAVPITNSGGGTAASIGATVNYSDFNTDTVVAVNDGAEISGGDINIAGSNEIDHVSVAGSAGMGPSDETESKGIVLNGMLSFVDGSSDILTVVDDGAELTANAQKQYTETVKDEETGEETEVTKTSEGNISISGHNDTNIVNVAAGLNLGSGSGAVGVGLAYNDFAVKNIAGVADVAGRIEGLYGTGTGDVTFANKYNKETAKDNEVGISAYGFDVDAATEGSIQSVSVAASASKNDDTGEVSFFGKIKGGISNVENDLLGSGGKLDTVTGKIFGTESGKANEMFNKGSSSHGTGGGIKLVGSTSGKGGFMPSFSIAGSGSVSLNSLNNATEAVVDNVNITMQPTSNVKGDISVTARDTLYAGAYSGAAALQWKKGGSADNTSVGFSGAAGVNDIDNAVKATIKNSIISNAGKIDTMALSGGEQLALGLGLAVVKADGTSGVSGNTAVSVNLIDHDVEALLENNIVRDTDDINVAAYARDIENTGGGTLSAGQQKVGVGATVAVAQLNNNISAGIKGGSYTDVGNVDVDAMNALKNITVGIAAGATVSSGGDGASAVVEGAGVYNEVHNTTNAFIEGTDEKDVVISTVNTVSDDETGNVNVIAQDVGINNDYEKVLTNELTDGKEEIAKRMGSDFDITGASELNGIETDDIKAQLNNKDAEGTGTQSNENSTEEVNLNKDGGSSIITVAGVIAATTGEGAGGAAVAITDIENNYTANVEYAQITAEELNAEAGSDSNIVTVSGGIAAASKGSGVGSVTWNDVENTAKANIKDSVVNAQTTLAKAVNKAQIVSVAGQISGAGKAGVGATLSYIGLDNSTEANITNTTFDKRDQAENEGITVTADAKNGSGSYNVAAGVSVSGEVVVSGNVAVTQTHGTSGAVIDGAIINNAKKVSAHALDDTDILSVIGTVSAAGTASVGAGVAYTEIGSTSTNEDDAQQTVAAIENTDITTAASTSGSTVSAQATDSSKVINVAVGIGGAGTAAVQGASATSLINKTTGAELTNTNIDKDSANSQNANVTVDAQNNSEITSSADVASVAGTAGVGAGVAVNRIKQNTQAALNGGTMYINNLTVNANGTPRIENIGIGVGAGGTAGVTGSVAVNMIANNVTAHIGNGANVVADGSVGVVATSDEQIANYAGVLAGGGTAGAGASVSVNQINGNTSATVGGDKEDKTSVTAFGNSDVLTTNTGVADSEINNALISDETVAINSKIDRTTETRKGLVVDASSTRDMKSFLVTAGVAGNAGLAGTVNVNMIDGITNAGIVNTTVNGGTANTSDVGNVFVNAGDYTNMSGFVGSAGFAVSGAGVGLASDTNTVSREVSAIVKDSDIKANTLEVDADSKQGVSSYALGAGVAAVGGGVAGVVTVTELNNATKAALQNSKVNANSVIVNANHKGIVNAGNSGLGVGITGAGVGLSVGVLKDNSQTYAEVTGDNKNEDTINASNDVKIAATNTAVANPVIYSLGAGAVGVGGATSVNNLNSKVATNISGVGITSGGSISGTAQNNFNIDADMGSIGAGAVGVGVGVTVNTIDSTVQTNVTGSTLNAAEDITLTAKETRDIDQLATNVAAGAAAAGANIAITTVGQEITDKDTKEKIDDANSVYGQDADELIAGAGSALAAAGISKTKVTPSVSAGYGGGKDSQITVNITNSDIDAGNNVTANATETDNINMTLGSGAAGAIAGNVGVGILNVHRNVGVNINGGSLNADNKVDIGTDITGSANLEIYQGSVGVIGATVAVGEVNTTGSSDITIDGTKIAAKNVSIIAQDNAKTVLKALGVSGGGLAGIGALAADAENNSDISVNITGSTITSTAEKSNDKDGNIVYDGGNIEITTNKANVVTAQAVNTAGGMVGDAGMGATVSDNGSSVVKLNGNTMHADVNIDASAKTASTLTADILNGAAGSFVAGAVSAAMVNAGSENDRMITAVNIGSGNTFAAQNTNFTADSDIIESVDMDAFSVSGTYSVEGNGTELAAYTDVSVTADANNTYEGTADSENSNVKFEAENTVVQTADTSGISAAGGFATGTNIGNTTSNLKTKVDIKGSSADSNINNLTANANSYADIDNNVNGDGGAIADVSPYAAKVNNNYTADTDVVIGGTWNTAGSFDAQAVNGMDIDLKSDAVRAAVVGGSGTWLDNTINNAANVIVNGASITTGGAQSYIAQNNVDYAGEIAGSGYGGLNVNATDYSDDLDFTAGVNITGSTLHGTGNDASITAFASTQGDITAKNSLKSAGVIPVALAFSDYDIDYNNSVNIVDSDLTTDKADADITLAATDDTVVKLETIADTQGGAVGAASAEADNAFDRANKINVDESSTMLSTKDINLYAGADASGGKSNLNLQVLADAYNKTAVPVYTDPKLNNHMTQSNQIEMAGNAQSVRHINASAGKGTTTVTESAKEYKIWTGTSGSGEVASTALGNTIKNENANNYINITGTAKAGIHNQLDITIGGQTSTTDPVVENDKVITEGTVNYDKNNITINTGSTWFSKDDIEVGSITVINSLMTRYNQVMDYLHSYSKDSDAYKAYEAEKTLLLNEMAKAGFAEYADNGTLVPLDSIELPAVTLPDIVVSGGNINIETDTLKGTGNIIAQGAPQLTIKNESDMYLKVNNLTISDNGGIINVDAANMADFTGTQKADGISGKTPTITINGASADAGSFGSNKQVQADIGVFGDITNTAGNIVITNENYNILLNGNVNGRNITVTATHGDVTQQSSHGVLNIGNDPISRLQFSETVASKIQEYLYSKKSDGFISFENYQAYLGWLVNDVGITLEELGIKGETDYITVLDNQSDLINKVKGHESGGDSMTDEEVQKILDDKKAGGYDAWLKYLDEIDASYKYDLSSLEDNIVEEENAMVAGGNIYIDAVNINIGGLIQSGYGNYSTTLNSADKAKVDALDKEWQSNPKELLDSEVMGNDKYLINGGGETYNSDTQVYDYEVKVYYNPSTGQLLTESVRPDGGNIQISGKVSSTGNGRIIAMDGTSDVSIDTTAVNKDVKVNSITVNDITGLISIADKNTGNTTEYKNGLWRTYKTGETPGDWINGDVSYTYDPVENSQFAWTGGVTGERIESKEYTEDFLFWGALAYDKSEDLLKHIEQVEGYVETGTISSGDETSALKDGSLITGGYTGGDNMFTIKWDYTQNEDFVATDPVVKKVYDGTAGKIFGYGDFYYYWTETRGDQVSTTSGVKADNTIKIGFLNNGNSQGEIKVNSAQDMLLNGNISNATVVGQNNEIAGKGSVNLNSNNGSVSAIGSVNINSDDVNISAETGVDINHAAIGNTANINVATDSGDISFVSGAGSLNIEQMATGGTNAINAETGNVYLEAQGNILDAGTGTYAVKGQRIDLISHTGNIGALNDEGKIVNALRVLGGSELYSSDTMASSVNAQANGDIVLTQTNGNMRLGTINSDNGDAILTVNNGSFVDAHPSENNDNSSAQEKIDRWLEAGLINSGDEADKSSKAAAQAKQERMDGLEAKAAVLAEKSEGKHTVKDYTDAAADLAAALSGDPTESETAKNLQDAKNTYINAYKDTSASHSKAIADAEANGATADEIAAINEDFKNRYNSITEAYLDAQAAVYGDGFNAEEQQLISSYAEVNVDESNYGWSKNQLLYAIQESVLNSEPGTVQTVDTPNVTANNITLTALNGGIGIDGAAQFISNDELNNEENLKILAAAKAGDLTWGQNEDGIAGVTVRQQQAITVQVKQEGGKVDVTGKENVYLAGVKDTKLNVNGIDTDGDIRLQGDAGVNVDGTLSGVDLTIAGGTGDIAGNDGGYVKTDVTGNVNANADGDIYIHHTGDLKLLAVATNKSANFKADDNILMYTDPNTEAQGYINASVVNLTATDGSIGEADNAVRILDNGAVVNAIAENGNIILDGVHGDESTGELVLGTINGAMLDITSISDVSLGRAEDDSTEETEAVASSITITSDATIEAVNVDLVKGTADIGTSTTADNNFNLTAKGGSITQSSTHNITTDNVNVSSVNDIHLASQGNKVNSFIVNGLGTDNSINGSIELAGSKDDGFTANLNGVTVNDGGVTVTNYAENGILNISGGSVTTTDAEKGSVTFISEGSITSDATVNSAANINMNADGSIDNDGSLTAQNNVDVTTTAGAIDLGGSVTANTGNVEVETQSGEIEVSGDVTATAGNVDVTTGSGSITTTGNISGGTKVNVHSGNGAISIGDDNGNGTVNAGTDVSITTAEGAITTKGSITGGSNVTVDAGASGIINLGGAVMAETGDVSVETDSGTITTTGNVTGDDKVIINSGAGDVTVNGDVTAANEEVKVTTGGGDITTTGTISGNTDVKVDAGTSGSIELGGSVTANTGNVEVETDSGTITTSGNVTGGNDVNVTSGSGSINLGGNVEAETGLVNVTTGSDSITTTGNVSGHKDVTLESVDGNITVGGYTESEVENVTANVKGDGNIEFTGEVSASGDVQAEVTGEGDISTGSSASVSGTDITFTTNDGSITTGSSLTADKSIQLTTNTGNITTGADLTANENVDLNVNTGDITFGGNVNAGSENAVNGNITIDITNGGSIKDAENKDNKLTAIGSGGSETAGNIIITTGGAGDVDLYDLYATNAARIDIADGSLTLHEINGELVAMQLRTEGKDMNVENIVAGTQIVLTGSDMTLDQISQRPDADGMLVITPDNAEADKPIDNFTIGDIKTNSDSGIRFDRLWVNNSDIHISEGQLWFDKLYVEDNAHFSNDEMSAAIYGKPPLRDGSDSVYWINTEENRPESSLDMWLNGTGDWMYLRFTDDHIQESNGILLTLDEYDYVYDQRFTAENHLRWQHGRYLDEDWKQAYGYGLSLHNRYGLIDYQEFTETNAGSDEVAVEA